MVFIFGEHPEDLGAVIREEDKMLLRPASILAITRIASFDFSLRQVADRCNKPMLLGGPMAKANTAYFFLKESLVLGIQPIAELHRRWFL